MEIQERENKVNDFWDDAKIFEKQVKKMHPMVNTHSTTDHLLQQGYHIMDTLLQA